MSGRDGTTSRSSRHFLFICSFDETSMDSCILATIDESRRVSDLSGESMKDSNEVEVTSLEEAKSVIAALRARQRAQAHQMLAWRRTLKLQVSFNYREGFLHAKAIPLAASSSMRQSVGGNAERSIKAITSENHKTRSAREPMLRTVKY